MKTATGVLIALALAVVSIAHAASAPSLQPSIDLCVLDVPHVTATDAGMQVFEELHLTNFTEPPLQLVKVKVEVGVEVVDVRDDRVLASLAGDAPKSRLAQIGSPAAPRDTIVPAGGREVVFIEWPASKRPRAIEQVVTYARQPGVVTDVVHGARTAVSYETGASLGPPLHGGPRRLGTHGPGRTHRASIRTRPATGSATARTCWLSPTPR